MVTAIVLAAGSSKRMGKDNKLLLPFNNTTIIKQVVDQINNSNVQQTIIVTGHEAKKIEDALENEEVIFYNNENYHCGLTASIQTGVAKCETNGIMICLSDMVKLTSFDYNLLVEQFEISYTYETPCIIVPHYNDKKGNPVIFSNHFKEMILQNDNPEGCKNIIIENNQYVYTVEMPNDHVLIDIDFPNDYAELTK